jgi:N-acetylglucosaminyl-diphospho-decaprenol L-rhamnosyltransferase
VDLPATLPREPSEGPTLSVVVVNYRSWPDVQRLVESLLATAEVRSGRCEVVVVDNASPGPVPRSLLTARCGLTLIRNEQNLGFAAGVNTGWRASKGRWLLLLNPDVEIGDDLLARVLERAARHEADGQTGIVGFRLLDPDGTVQPSVGFEPSLLRSLRGQFIPRRRRKYQADRGLRAGPVPWVTGACALVDARLMRELGGMDEDFFLYYEEVALCRSARRRGRLVVYDPTVAVTHLRPLQNRPLTPSLRVITRHSKLLYFRKHLPGWQFVGLTWVVALESWLWRRLARLKGSKADEASWRVVGELARRARGGRWIVGTEVRDLACSVPEGEARDPVPARRPFWSRPGASTRVRGG